MKSTLQKTKIIALGIMIAIGVGCVSAWTGPTALPPGNNIPAPINTSSSTQTKYGNLLVNGLSVNTASILSGILQISLGNPTAGEVVTAQDASGTVGWGVAPSVLQSGGVVFMTPTTLASVVPGSTAPWTTIVLPSNIPASTTAIILQATGVSYNQPGAEIDVRTASGTPIYPMLIMGASQYQSNTSESQGIYPVSNNGGVLTFQYQVPSAFGSGGGVPNATIKLVGYIAGYGSGIGSSAYPVTSLVAGSHFTVSASSTVPGIVTVSSVSSGVPASGSIMGGWYGWTGSTGSATEWGNATIATRTGSFGGTFRYPTCPSGYTAQFSGFTETAGSSPYPTTNATYAYINAFCIKN